MTGSDLRSPRVLLDDFGRADGVSEPDESCPQ